MESSSLDISTAPMVSESECFCIYIDQLLPRSWGDANILIAQAASETETGDYFPNKI